MKEISLSLFPKAFDLRAFCFRQMADGVGETLYVANASSTEKDKTDEE